MRVVLLRLLLGIYMVYIQRKNTDVSVWEAHTPPPHPYACRVPPTDLSPTSTPTP